MDKVIKNILVTCLFIALPSSMHSQIDSIFDPSKKWFFGAEMGVTKIDSYSHNEPTTSFQGGLYSEYYFTKKWSVTARLKYFKIGESHGGASILPILSESYHRFDGEVISMPLNIKFEYKIIKNFRGNVKIGIAFNQETISKYQYPIDKSTNYATFFIDYNIGFGFSYFLTTYTAIYIDFEAKGLGKDRDDSSTFIVPHSTDNSFVNIGIKHNFKRKTEKK